MQNLTRPSIERLLRTAGIKRASGLIYEETRGLLIVYLEPVLRAASIRQSLLGTFPIDIQALVQSMPVQMYSPALDATQCPLIPTPPGNQRQDRTQEEIRYYQKQSECFLIPPTTFAKALEEKFSEYPLSLSARLHLQASAERYLIELFKDALMVAIDARRLTVMPKDLRLVRNIRREREPIYF
jgi:histone H3/H4